MGGQGKLEKSMLSFFVDNEETGWMLPDTAAAVKHMAARTAHAIPRGPHMHMHMDVDLALGVLDMTSEVRVVRGAL